MFFIIKAFILIAVLVVYGMTENKGFIDHGSVVSPPQTESKYVEKGAVFKKDKLQSIERGNTPYKKRINSQSNLIPLSKDSLPEKTKNGAILIEANPNNIKSNTYFQDKKILEKGKKNEEKIENGAILIRAGN